jgi:hypothetical protein
LKKTLAFLSTSDMSCVNKGDQQKGRKPRCQSVTEAQKNPSQGWEKEEKKHLASVRLRPGQLSERNWRPQFETRDMGSLYPLNHGTWGGYL